MLNEDGKCPMAETIKRMQQDIDKGENNTKEITKIVSEIKEGHNETKYTMKNIQDTQSSMSNLDKEFKAAIAITNKETKDMMAAGFKDIANEKAEDKKQAEADKKETEKQLIIDKKDLAKEKRMQIWGLWLIGAGIAFNTIYGMFVKYAPQLIGLGK